MNRDRRSGSCRTTATAHRDATIPEDQPRKVSECTDRLPSLCFVLHRMGFFLPRELLHER